jgi:hypothetical protein
MKKLDHPQLPLAENAISGFPNRLRSLVMNNSSFLDTAASNMAIGNKIILGYLLTNKLFNMKKGLFNPYRFPRASSFRQGQT